MWKPKIQVFDSRPTIKVFSQLGPFVKHQEENNWDSGDNKLILTKFKVIINLNGAKKVTLINQIWPMSM